MPPPFCQLDPASAAAAAAAGGGHPFVLPGQQMQPPPSVFGDGGGGGGGHQPFGGAVAPVFGVGTIGADPPVHGQQHFHQQPRPPQQGGGTGRDSRTDVVMR